MFDSGRPGARRVAEIIGERTATPTRARTLVLVGCILTLAACSSGSDHTATEVPDKEAPPPGKVPDDRPGSLLFASGFEEGVQLQPPGECFDVGCWQRIAGTDLSTGFGWPPATLTRNAGIQLLVDEPVSAETADEFMVSEIRDVTGPGGEPTRALYSEIRNSGCCGANPQDDGATQSPLVLLFDSPPGDFYVSYWLRFQPDLPQLMASGTWRSLFTVKTGTPGKDDGDYRIGAYVRTDQGVDAMHWSCEGDNVAGGDYPAMNEWLEANTEIPVPVDEWFKFEAFVHRSTADDGRVWMAVDGQVICDHLGPNAGAATLPINRVMMPSLYSGSAYPIYQWVDDVQVWSGFPTSSDDPPYAPH